MPVARALTSCPLGIESLFLYLCWIFMSSCTLFTQHVDFKYATKFHLYPFLLSALSLEALDRAQLFFLLDP